MNKEISKFTLCVIIAVLIFLSGCSLQSKSRCDLANVLDRYGWSSYVGRGTGVWVSIARQELVLVHDYRVAKWYWCSTAAAGAGYLQDSEKTPLGWHKIGAKIGDRLTAGAVLKDRQWTGEVWSPGQDTEQDLILSRILWLEGLQDGINRGGEVDSWNRYIYIHGTNRIDELGKPASAGCVRLAPEDVIDLYERIEVGTKVLITMD